jgi:hypothetical protein
VEPAQLISGSLGETARTIVCNSQLRTPSLAADEKLLNEFFSLSTTPAGDGEIYYKNLETDDVSGTLRFLLLIKFKDEKNFRNHWPISSSCI